MTHYDSIDSLTAGNKGFVSDELFENRITYDCVSVQVSWIRNCQNHETPEQLARGLEDSQYVAMAWMDRIEDHPFDELTDAQYDALLQHEQGRVRCKAIQMKSHRPTPEQMSRGLRTANSDYERQVWLYDETMIPTHEDFMIALNASKERGFFFDRTEGTLDPETEKFLYEPNLLSLLLK